MNRFWVAVIIALVFIAAIYGLQFFGGQLEYAAHGTDRNFLGLCYAVAIVLAVFSALGFFAVIARRRKRP